jgi:hypothetical protein
MGEHSAPTPGKFVTAVRWLLANKGKVASALIVAVPFVSRYVPGFPTDEVVSVLRLFLGA